MINVGIIDDSKSIRLLTDVCIANEPDIQLVWELVNFIEEDTKNLQQPHVILLDIFLNGQNGLELIPIITSLFPATGILMITRVEDTSYILDAIKNGAIGYLMKDLIYTQLPLAIRTIYSGKAYLCPQTSTALVSYLRS